MKCGGALESKCRKEVAAAGVVDAGGGGRGGGANWGNMGTTLVLCGFNKDGCVCCCCCCCGCC